MYQYLRVLAVILILSSIAQALSAYFYKRKAPRAAIVALFGLKVGVETWLKIRDEAPGEYAPCPRLSCR